MSNLNLLQLSKNKELICGLEKSNYFNRRIDNLKIKHFEQEYLIHWHNSLMTDDIKEIHLENLKFLDQLFFNYLIRLEKMPVFQSILYKLLGSTVFRNLPSQYEYIAEKISELKDKLIDIENKNKNKRDIESQQLQAFENFEQKLELKSNLLIENMNKNQKKIEIQQIRRSDNFKKILYSKFKLLIEHTSKNQKIGIQQIQALDSLKQKLTEIFIQTQLNNEKMLVNHLNDDHNPMLNTKLYKKDFAIILFETGIYDAVKNMKQFKHLKPNKIAEILSFVALDQKPENLYQTFQRAFSKLEKARSDYEEEKGEKTTKDNWHKKYENSDLEVDYKLHDRVKEIVNNYLNNEKKK